jgi:hypothetical protein
MMKKTLKNLVIASALLTVLNGCSEFALLASGASVAASQNAYARAYSGIDVLTIMSTEKDIKTHIYTKTKEFIDDQRR